jgi:hypothetical protein
MNKQLQNDFKRYKSDGKLILSEYHCGPGSTLWYTKPLRNSLLQLIEKHNIKSMLDAPCGDHQWMNFIKFPTNFDYTGADLHDDMVERNNRIYGNKFIQLDITEDPLPSKDLMFVRDCLFHFKSETKRKFFQNLLKTDFKFLLTSNHPRCNTNIDNQVDGETFSEINWKISPWNFPNPIDTIVDYDESDDRFKPYPYRTMELWSKEQLQSIL